VQAYRQATLLDPRFAEAYVNWGRLLHDMGSVSSAERVYRAGLRKCRRHALLSFNLGVVLESTSRPEDAISAYLDALELDAGLSDCHYNLARLYDQLGDAQAAIRHFSQYRRLSR
jgi:tetratricopeptide (TPR) repeat protein